VTGLPTQATGSPISSRQLSSNCPDRDLWNEALQSLTDEEKASILKYGLPAGAGPNLMLETLLEVTQEKQKECEEKYWVFELKGRRIVLRDVAKKVIGWLDKFKEIGDIAVSVDPVHAGLPWAGIRLLLQVQSIVNCFIQ
jgi:hypothetical protein